MVDVKLKVMEALQEEAYKGIVRIDAETMRAIDVRQGGVVEIEGNKRTVGIVDRAYPTDVGQAIIRMDGILRRNAKTGIGEMVNVRKADVKEAKSVTIAPAQKGVTIQADAVLFKRGLLGRALVKGDQVALGGARSRRRTMEGSPFEEIFEAFEQGFMGPFGLGGLKFIVVETNPKQAVIVAENTTITLSPKAVEVSEEKVIDITYEDIGGLEEELKKVRELVETPLRHPELFQKLGIDPPAGILLYGPPGSGKTLLAKAVANESEANFILLNGPEVMNKFYGESEKRVRELFEEAEKNAPSIIFIDEIDAIAPKREEVHGEVERRVVSQLLTTMDGLKSRGRVVVIGATNRPNALDPALRRPGRFDREIQIGVPNKVARLEILKIHTRNMPLSKDVNLEDLANVTHGFVGADLSALAKEAAMNVLRKVLHDVQLRDKEPVPQEVLDKIIIESKDFKEALKTVRPSAMREVLIETPNVGWSDIGGLEELKQELKEAVEWPIKNPDSFKRLGVRPPRGILIYGPPGTGKTLLAKAVAKESEANFILVKGPSLLNMWVGESLPYDENLIVKDKDTIKKMSIGQIVENKEDVEVVAFDHDRKARFSKIADFIKHPLRTKLLEVVTKTGRRIRVTDRHSLFTIQNGKVESIQTHDLMPGSSYIAIPKRLPLPNLAVDGINLLDNFSGDSNVFVRDNFGYLKGCILKIGHKNAAKLLGVSKKYLYDILRRNIPVPVPKFLKLIKHCNVKVDPHKLFIKYKGSRYEAPAFLKLSDDLLRLLGLWVAGGDLNGCTVRIHAFDKEIRKDLSGMLKKLGFSYSSMPTCFTINSRLFQKIVNEVFNLKHGARNKNVPPLVFTLNKRLRESFLRGYFSGDGSIYKNERSYIIEASTESKCLADDLMYLLLGHGIVASCYHKKEWNGALSYRVLFMGVDNFRKFRDIGFIDKKRNSMIFEYINLKKWERSDLIPIPDDLKKEICAYKSVYKSNKMIGKGMLRRILNKIDSKKEKYKHLWDIINGDIFFDLVKEIHEINYKGYVYDLSINPKQNFVAGFGGVFAHNSEKGVRQIFEKARQSAPTVIFFDEIDSIASRRGMDVGSRVTERVVNTLLAEMDGLEELHDVVVIGATNRPDILDPALLRPGRFDRLLLTPPPDYKSRLEIFRIHTEVRKMPLAKDVKIEDLAKATEGYSGSDIEAVCREAAMLALREDIKAKEVKKKHFESSMNKVSPSIPKDTMDKYKAIEEEYLKSAKAALQRDKQNYFG